MKAILLFASTALLSQCAFASFSLDTSGPDWDYTTKTGLVNTTSQECKTAYSAPINCDPTLLGLVASMRPAFKPTDVDLARTCISDCSKSLQDYVANVKKACNQKTDLAKESLGGECCRYINDRVEVVGQVFQYTFAKSCSKDSHGQYCYNASTSSITPDCSSECSVEFYTAAHDYPASAKHFNYYALIGQSKYWLDDFKSGYDTIQACGRAGNSTSEVLQSGKSANTVIGGANQTAVAVSSAAASSTTNTSTTSPSVIATGTATVGASPQSRAPSTHVDLMAILLPYFLGLMLVSSLTAI